MSWSDLLYQYCERGADPSFWAEPVNALTNAAFLLAAVVAACEFMRLPNHARTLDRALLIGLVFVIGVGSFLFHTFATRWALLADSAPIGLFMLGYFTFALRQLLGLNWPWVAIWLAGFMAALWLVGRIECAPSFLANSNALGRPCFNGSLVYAPAALAMLAIGLVLMVRRHRASKLILGAGALFVISLALRTLDFEFCTTDRLFGAHIGTHFMWHILNATVLYMLLRAALLHGPERTAAKGLH